MNVQPDLTAYDQPSRVLNVLSFVCPPLGLIVYLALVGKLPRQAMSAGRSATKGAALFVGAFLLMTLITGILEFNSSLNEPVNPTSAALTAAPVDAAPVGVPPPTPAGVPTTNP